MSVCVCVCEGERERERARYAVAAKDASVESKPLLSLLFNDKASLHNTSCHTCIFLSFTIRSV